MLENLNIIDDFISLIYPKICVSCKETLLKHEIYLCEKCRENLPRPKFHINIEESNIRKILYGRIPVFGSAAYYLFHKKTGVQNILHHIKYKKGKDLAQTIGSWMGYELSTCEWIKDVEGVVPIPLHPKKQLGRGYNQSEEYSKGISNETKIPIINVLKKDIYTTTQTKKKRFERWENVKDNFAVSENVSQYNHLMLVDDVLTTGATFEAAYNTLVKSGYKGKISIVVIAMATHLI